MFNLISVICYATIGFGVGGIIFKGKDAKNVIKQFANFKKDKETQILQIKQSKEKQQFQVQELTKENNELQKKYNRSLRNIELLQMKSIETKVKIDDEMDDILSI